MDSANLLLFLIGLTIYFWCRYYCRPDVDEESTGELKVILELNNLWVCRSSAVLVVNLEVFIP